MRDAIDGLFGRWPLVAEIQTDLGTLECELWDEVAPITVANFVGLARGLRPFRDGENWVQRPAYDGGSFHRVIDGFMIQGGDPTGTGRGEAGYVIPNEIDDSIAADRAGLLYMAHRGKDTGSIQFFILDAPAPHIAGGYTAFGSCSPEHVIHAIARAPKQGERPDPPVRIRSIRVRLSPGCE
jgi:peptidyl-prolyl cis-trans isomerase A (cyclophilin A)